MAGGPLAGDLPFSQACENNKRPILAVLRRHLVAPATVLEIGSGTGQHAVFFAAELPHVIWQPTDVAAHLPGIRAWVEACPSPNLRLPLALDVEWQPWPVEACDAVFSANTAHIMSWPMVQAFVAGVGTILGRDGRLFLYGPFHYGGQPTSPSNAAFDASLRRRDPASGVRDFEAVDALARAAGLTFVEDNPMPANNRLLVWRT